MNISEDIRPISYIKANTTRVVNQVNETRRPVFITQNGEPRGVLMDAESYEAMRNALAILKVAALGEKEIKHGRSAEQSDFFAYIDKNFKKTMP